MAVVKINAIEVPPGAGPELEKRFAHRAHAVDNQPGFLGFQVLPRPISPCTSTRGRPVPPRKSSSAQLTVPSCR